MRIGPSPKAAYILDACRTPGGRANKGSSATPVPTTSPPPSSVDCWRAPASTRPGIDDVILGCALPEGEQGMNVARIAALRAGLPVDGAGA